MDVLTPLSIVVAGALIASCALDRSPLRGTVPDDGDSGDTDAGDALDAAPRFDGCTPAPETCNATDDDCDGSIDEAISDLTCGVGVCGVTIPGCVDGGVPTCQAGVPDLEVCTTSIDEDCDGTVDEHACSLELFRYPADLLPEDDGWTPQCQGSCGTLSAPTVSDGVLRIEDRSTTASHWFVRRWTITSGATGIARFDVSAVDASGATGAFVAATLGITRHLVSIYPDRLEVDGDCTPAVVPVAAGAHRVTIELGPTTARTLVDESVVDERAPCPRSPGGGDSVLFGTGGRPTTATLLVDAVVAYERR